MAAKTWVASLASPMALGKPGRHKGAVTDGAVLATSQQLSRVIETTVTVGGV